MDNNTGHNSDNHNSIAPEIPICDFHDSTYWSTWRDSNLESRQ